MPQFVLNVQDLDIAINKTGFPTEYKVQQILEAHGWKVISNRYYIDDQKKIEREIDLLATKNGVKLIISCKKSDTVFWAFMTSAATDINMPFEYRTDNKIVNYYLQNEGDVFLSVASAYPGLSKILNLPETVRAFQEININSYSPQNDKHIYDSIITAIKAADYEASHSKTNTVYFMISLFDGEIVKKDFGTGNSEVIEEVKYVNRHFIGDEDKLYCVHFIKFDAFDRILDQYDKAVDELPRLIEDLRNEFTTDVFDHPERVKYFQRDIENEFFSGLYDEYGFSGTSFASLSTNATDIRYYFAKSGKLHVAFNLMFFTNSRTFGMRINQDEFCHNLMARLLKKYFGYEGQFVIENDPETEERLKIEYKMK